MINPAKYSIGVVLSLRIAKLCWSCDYRWQLFGWGGILLYFFKWTQLLIFLPAIKYLANAKYFPAITSSFKVTYVQTRLFPEQWHAASDLYIGWYRVFQEYYLTNKKSALCRIVAEIDWELTARCLEGYLLRLHKVGHVAIVISASSVEPRAGSLAAQTRDNTRLDLSAARVYSPDVDTAADTFD